MSTTVVDAERDGVSAEVRERVRRCVTEAVAEVNQLREADDQVSATPDAVLFGEGGPLDSLGVVNLAVALEGTVEREFQASAGLVADILSATDAEAFRTVDLLVDFAAVRVARVIG